MKHKLQVFFSVFFLCGRAQGSSGQGQHPPNFYSKAAELLGADPTYGAVLASLGALLLLILLGVFYKRSVFRSLEEKKFEPGGEKPLLLAVNFILEFWGKTNKEQFAERKKDFELLIVSLFIFILINNLTGLVPGFPPATENFGINLGLGAVVFLFYNYAGIKEHGGNYIKQFTGPFLLLAPFFLLLESVSHAARPLSLAFRLTANIFGDHLVLGIFSQLVPLFVPVVFMFFGLLVAAIQSFVFSVLTGIYISISISHDH
jgi:F-type H+-transporting ATPase subunit a